MKPKVIKTQEEYQAALTYLNGLMDSLPGSPEEEELELFSTLIEQYESEHYPVPLPDPIEAIKYQMEQQGLSRKDLAKYIGSQSKVSEVLNRKRPLSLSMIRALNTGLGIPAEILLQEPGKDLEPIQYDYHDYPFQEMLARDYFPGFAGTLTEAKNDGEELLRGLFEPIQQLTMQRVYRRQSVPARSRTKSAGIAEKLTMYQTTEGKKDPRDRFVDDHALAAWHARALSLAEEQRLPPYAQTKINIEFIHGVVHLSYFAKGPLLVKEMLEKNGIAFVLLPHLPHTYLDGASFKTKNGRAVIALTLRYNRFDNFWFTLIHELAHVYLHFKDNLAFFDDTDTQYESEVDPLEAEANKMTWDMLIPNDVWDRSKKILINEVRENEITSFANDLRISPAIVAGRIRWETGDYTRFTKLIGNNKVREIFSASTAHT